MKGKRTTYKYKQACIDQGYTFVPFVWTTDGALGPAAQALLKKIGKALATRWGKPLGLVMNWIQVRISVAIAVTTSVCIRNSRGSVEELEDNIAYDGAVLSLRQEGGID